MTLLGADAIHGKAARELAPPHDPPQADPGGEPKARAVALLTVVMMGAELGVGYRSGSLALTADGWHMGTHAFALALSAFAYWFARTRARVQHFTFGTGKVFALAGYTNALLLAVVAVSVGWDSIRHLLHPQPILFAEALPVAIVGLVVNVVSALILNPSLLRLGKRGETTPSRSDRDHHHGHGHSHAQPPQIPPHRGVENTENLLSAVGDHNLQAAYLHVLADALTSVLAIVALVLGAKMGWVALDPLSGLLAGILILRWALGLCRETSRQLLDALPSPVAAEAIRQRVESMDDARIIDLHIWEMGPGQQGCIVSLITSRPRPPADYRAAILAVANVQHVTVEVHRCPSHDEVDPLACRG